MAQNAKDIQLRELKDLLRELRETNKLLQKTLEETQKEKAVLRQERDNFFRLVNINAGHEPVKLPPGQVPDFRSVPWPPIPAPADPVLLQQIIRMLHPALC